MVLGSDVYMRRWRREARRFRAPSRPHAWPSGRLGVQLGPVGDPAKDNAAWLEPGRTIAEAERLGARAHVVFGGVSKASSIPAEFRDRRDWEAISAWARAIAAELPVPAGR